MTVTARKNYLQTIAALLRATKAHLRLAAAIIAATLAFSTQTGAKAFQEARQSILYVAAPLVSSPAAQEAGQISRSYAKSASPGTLMALGVPHETSRNHTIEKALASIALPPSEDTQIAVTHEAALRAGELYMAQRSGRFPADGQQGEYASARPVRPELGDGTVVELQRDRTASAASPPEMAVDEGVPVEEVPSDDIPVPVEGSRERAHADSPEPSEGYGDLGDVPATYPSGSTTPSGDSSGPDYETLGAEPVELASSTDGDGGDTTSMTGPISTAEQVPTSMAGEGMDAGSGEDDSRDSSSDGGSPEVRSSGGSAEEPQQEQLPSSESEEIALASDRRPMQPASSGAPEEDTAETPKRESVSYPQLAPQPGVPGSERNGNRPESVPVAQDTSVDEEESGQPYAVLPDPSGEDSLQSPQGAESSTSSAPGEGESHKQDVRIVSVSQEQRAREAVRDPEGEQGTLAPPGRGTPPSAAPKQETDNDGAGIVLIVAPPEEGGAGHGGAAKEVPPSREIPDGRSSEEQPASKAPHAPHEQQPGQAPPQKTPENERARVESPAARQLSAEGCASGLDYPEDADCGGRPEPGFGPTPVEPAPGLSPVPETPRGGSSADGSDPERGKPNGGGDPGPLPPASSPKDESHRGSKPPASQPPADDSSSGTEPDDAAAGTQPDAPTPDASRQDSGGSAPAPATAHNPSASKPATPQPGPHVPSTASLETKLRSAIWAARKDDRIKVARQQEAAEPVDAEQASRQAHLRELEGQRHAGELAAADSGTPQQDAQPSSPKSNEPQAEPTIPSKPTLPRSSPPQPRPAVQRPQADPQRT